LHLQNKLITVIQKLSLSHNKASKWTPSRIPSYHHHHRYSERRSVSTSRDESPVREIG
jgi:hypothetical protein